MYKILFSFVILSLSACAPVLQAPEMMPRSSVFNGLEAPALKNNISIGSVIADPDLGGMTAPITTDEYKNAIILALRQAGWYAQSANGTFQIEAHLKEVNAPFIGLNFTVDTKAEYILREKNGKVVYQDTLHLPCTVPFSDSWVGSERLRKAIACSVAENITHLLKTLSQRY